MHYDIETQYDGEIKKVDIDSEDYPPLLRFIKDPPKLLYYCGDLSICKNLCLAVVGARHASPYGRWAAYQIAQRAAEYGVAVVSGMASGADSAAHKGALDIGGKTIAVLGCGADVCYPKSNMDLMCKIRKTGLILSEYPPGSRPQAFQFPLRNRIISGLSRAVVIAEAGLSSGSLITAERAAEQGREVFAVPGNINAACGIGTNKLIQDGATPVVVIDDVLNGLGIQKKCRKDAEFESLGSDEKQLLQIVAGQGEVTADHLCRVTGKSAGEIGSILTILEMKGWVQTTMGKIYIAKAEF